MRERRGVPRYICDLKAHLLLPDSGFRPAVSMVSLSVRGGSFQVEAGPGTLSAGQKCNLNIEWQGKDLQTEAEIVWKNPSGRIGFKFETMPEETLALLKQLCSAIPLQPLQPPTPMPPAHKK